MISQIRRKLRLRGMTMELLKQWDMEGAAITLLQEKVWSIDHSYILKAYDKAIRKSSRFQSSRRMPWEL